MWSEFISQAELSKICGVSRRTIVRWAKRGRVPLDPATGRCLRADAEIALAPHVCVSRLYDALNQLPARNVLYVLIETLGIDFVRALGRAVGTSNKSEEWGNDMSNVE